MKPISFSIDLPVLVVASAALALAGHGAIYVTIAAEPLPQTWGLTTICLVLAVCWLWRALDTLLDDRLASAIACFVPCLIPAAVYATLGAPIVLPALAFLFWAACKVARKPAGLAGAAVLAALAVLLDPTNIEGATTLNARLMPLISFLPVCLLGLAAGWNRPVPALCAVFCLILVGLQAYGVLVDLVPLLVLSTCAAGPAVQYALREIPKKQSFVLWMALPTVMYSLFWIAMMPIRPHFYPFTLTTWTG